MKRLRLYLDTTVWNYPFADDTPEKKAHTLDFFRRVRWGAFEVFTSDVVTDEFADAGAERRMELLNLWEQVSPALLPVTDEARTLAASYLANKALPPRSKADALHVALTTVHQLDALVSWNFKHLANLRRRAQLAAVNLSQGYVHPLALVILWSCSMKSKDNAKESKTLLEVRAWKARVSRDIERKGWDRFLKDAHASSEKWQRDVEALRRSKTLKSAA